MFSAAEMAELVETAESTMVDTFDAYAVTSGRVDGWDTSTVVKQYETKGELAGDSEANAQTHGRTVEIGDIERRVIEGGLKIPLSQPAPAEGWVFKCTAVAPGIGDPANVGRCWQVVETRTRSLAVKRRLDVVEVPDPTEPEEG